MYCIRTIVQKHDLVLDTVDTLLLIGVIPSHHKGLKMSVVKFEVLT